MPLFQGFRPVTGTICPSRAAAVVRPSRAPKGMKKGRRPRRRPRLKLSDKAGPDQCPVPGENALFPAQIAGFLAVSRAVPVYPVFLNYVVPVQLCKTSIVCLGKPGLYKEPEQSLSAEQLSQQAIIIHDPVFLSSEVLSLQMELIRNRNRSNIHFSDSVAGAITLARAGYGLALVPEIYAHNCDDLALYRLSGVPELTFGLFYNEQDRDDTLKAFVSLTQKAYAV